MSDLHILTASVIETLEHISQQAAGLAKGLEEAAPAKPDTPNKSVEYLSATAQQLVDIINECKKLQQHAAPARKHDI